MLFIPIAFYFTTNAMEEGDIIMKYNSYEPNESKQVNFKERHAKHEIIEICLMGVSASLMLSNAIVMIFGHAFLNIIDYCVFAAVVFCLMLYLASVIVLIVNRNKRIDQNVLKREYRFLFITEVCTLAISGLVLAAGTFLTMFAFLYSSLTSYGFLIRMLITLLCLIACASMLASLRFYRLDFFRAKQNENKTR